METMLNKLGNYQSKIKLLTREVVKMWKKHNSRKNQPLISSKKMEGEEVKENLLSTFVGLFHIITFL